MRNEDSKAKNEWAIDAERRSEKRLKVENEFTLTVIPGGRNLSKEKIIYTLGRDISFCGARIQSRSFLPVDTLLDIKVAFNHPFRMMSALGKVKWIKSLFADEFYEAGLEFVSRPR